jgi:hypothetical protein
LTAQAGNKPLNTDITAKCLSGTKGEALEHAHDSVIGSRPADVVIRHARSYILARISERKLNERDDAWLPSH